MQCTSNMTSVEELNRANRGKLPGYMGLEITAAEPGYVAGRIDVRPDLSAHTGYLLGGAVLSVADIICAYGISTAWPEGASGFTTVEATCNFMGSLRSGAGICTAKLRHGGHSSQVWDAEFTDEATGRLLAVFRCTQIFHYPHG